MKKTISKLLLLVGVLCGVSLSAQAQDSVAIAQPLATAYNLYLNNPDSAIGLTNRSLQRAIAARSRYLEGYGYYILSKAYWAKASYRLSTEFGFEALRIFESSPYVHEWGESLLSLARTFTDLQNFPQATLYLQRATRLATDHNNTALLADAYREHSMLMLLEKKYDSTLYYADKGLAIYEPARDTLEASILYLRKAKTYFNLKDFARCRVFTRKAIFFDSLSGNRRALAISYFVAAQTHHALRRYDSAEMFLHKSIAINGALGNLPTLIGAHELLASIYRGTGRPLQALPNLTLANQYQDSLYDQQRNGNIQEMQSLYELEKKENTILMLEKDNAFKQQQVKNQRWFSLFLLVAMFLLIFLIFGLWRLRLIQSKANAALAMKNRAIEQQKEEMQAQAESLQELNHLKSKLFSVISHDLRGPITNLQSLLMLLTNQLVTPEEFVALSDKLRLNLNVTQRTLENLLNWSLSQMDGIKTDRRRIDMKASMDEACKLMEEVAQRKNITIQNTSATPVFVMADANHVQLVLRNLLHNAIKFSKHDGKVLMSTTEQDGHCLVRIRDFGIGMTNEEKEILLSSREYFTKTGTNQEKGTGLGFMLCKEFIERNEGDIHIESAPGMGTEISFTLPLAD